MVTSQQADVLGQQIADFLGQGNDLGFVALAVEHVTIVTALARSYTRGRGFGTDGYPLEDVAAVIVTATARLLANPEQIEHTVGGVRVGAGFSGWSLAETFVLNRHRKRAS